MEHKITMDSFYKDTAQKLFLQLMNDRDKLEKEYNSSGLTKEMSMDEYAAKKATECADILTVEVYYKGV